MVCFAECVAVLTGVNSICQCCFCAPVKEAGDECIRSCLNLEKNWDSLDQEREALKAATVALEERCAPLNKEVDQWLGSVATLAVNESRLRAEYDTLERCLCRCTPNIWRRLQLGEKVSRELQYVRKLSDRRKDLNSSCLQRLPSTVEARTHQEPVGMDPLLGRLCGRFDDKTSSVIGIHGLPGVGKTMLLSVFNNKLEERGDCDVVIFIEVSNHQVLDVAGMQRRISRRLGLPWDNAESEAIRAESFLGVLTKKKFVILLDDVRKAFKLEEVGIPDPSGADMRGKLILASQSEDVCVEMKAHRSMIEVKCLESDWAWDLFQRNLSNEAKTAIERDHVIMENARAIAGSCGGLPLAINAIGSAVASLTDRSAWRKAAKRVKKNLSHLAGMDNFFPSLKYCYDQLKTENHRICFLYCVLFPENGSIKKSKITGYCMPEDHKLKYDGWNKIIRDLASASLLERSASEVKMHSIIRELALWLASAEFLVQAGRGLKEAPVPREWERASRISLMFNDIEKLDISPECTTLSTLLLQNNPNLKELSPDFFKNMPGLRVLDLSHTAIKELPIASGTLRRLQHLNLCHTRIAKLPKELSNLKELRHLDLSETSALDEIPDGTISVLKMLRVLNLYRSLYEFRGRGDLNLEQLVNLEFLGITVHSEEVLEKLKTDDRLARSTRCLSLQSCEGMKCVRLSVFQHMGSLKVLFVHDCSALKHLSLHDMREEGLNLQELTLASLPNFEGIIPGGGPQPQPQPQPSRQHHLDKLRDLTIESCHKLENVTWILQLESLERLVISKCDAMEQVVHEGIVGDVSNQRQQNGASAIVPTIESSFRCLQSIILKDLKNLESICHPRRPFPCLKITTVDSCPKLKSRPWVVKSVSPPTCGKYGLTTSQR